MWIDHLLLTIHLVAAASWIGAALAMQVIAARMTPVSADAAVDQFAHDSEAVGKTIFGPAGAVLLLSGAALVVHEDLAWGKPWILLGILAMAVAGSVGGAYLIPEGRRIAALASQPGHDPAEVRARARRRFLVARVDLVVLLLAVADMVFRPGG